jgi:hypothetical protein
MKFSGSLLARLALLAAAAATVLTSQAALAAPARPAAPVKFTWHTLKLVNGWKSASTKTLRTGTPAWALHDDVVYLRGAIRNPAQAGDEFARLPAYVEPPSNIYTEDYVASGVPGAVWIALDGWLNVYNGNSPDLISLAGISYPLATIKPHPLILKNDWTSEQEAYQSGDPAYAISHGVVYLSGSMGAGQIGATAARLPKAARPSHLMYVPTYTYSGTPGFLEILPGGYIQAYGTNADHYTSLANISYPVTGTKWHNFKLTSGWKSADPIAGTGAPVYTVSNGVVYVAGSMYQKSGKSDRWTSIPLAARPANVVELEAFILNAYPGMVSFATAGLLNGGPGTLTSLAAIAYPLSS